jgi:hypothetical protein
MTIKQQGGIFGRNPTFNDVTIEGELTFDGDIDVNSDLKVSGDLEVLGDITINSSPFPEIILKDADLSNVYGRIYSASGNTAIESDVTNQQAGSSLLFTVDGDTKAQISSGGNLTVNNGNLIMGTSGRGIDYEEGNWTPVVTASSGAITSYSASGSYTKVGRQVTLSGVIEITNNGTGAGYVTVSGLPFTIGAQGGSGAVRSGGFGGHLVAIQAPNGVTTFNMWKYDNTYPVGTNSNMNFSFSYFV